MRFACGLSDEVPMYLSQELFFKSRRPELKSLDLLRENEVFAQDLFQKMPSKEVLTLNFRNAKLGTNELQSLSRHCEVQKLALILANQEDIKNVFSRYDPQGRVGLKRLSLHGVLKVGVKYLSEAVRAGKLPQLKEMYLLFHNTLTGCVKDLFGGPDHPGFPSLENLYLSNTDLNREDIESLGEAVSAGKLPQLKKMTLSDNTLTGCLKDLFGGPDHPGFPSLEELILDATNLNREDVESLSEAVSAGKLPQLKEMHLSHNTLTGCLKDLFGGPNHPGFPSLVFLYLSHTDLNREDMESLGEAVRTGKLPQLKKMTLFDDTLTGCLKDLFGGPDHPGFPSLEELILGATNLNREHVESLSKAIRAGKLPQLTYLRLLYNGLGLMEREVEDLIAACDAHSEKHLKLDLRFSTGLNSEFIKRCKDKYHNVKTC